MCNLRNHGLLISGILLLPQIILLAEADRKLTNDGLIFWPLSPGDTFVQQVSPPPCYATNTCVRATCRIEKDIGLSYPSTVSFHYQEFLEPENITERAYLNLTGPYHLETFCNGFFQVMVGELQNETDFLYVDRECQFANFSKYTTWAGWFVAGANTSAFAWSNVPGWHVLLKVPAKDRYYFFFVPFQYIGPVPLPTSFPSNKFTTAPRVFDPNEPLPIKTNAKKRKEVEQIIQTDIVDRWNLTALLGVSCNV